MREQVMVLPPSTERRRTNFSLSKKVVSEEKDAETIRNFLLSNRDQQRAIEPEFVSTQRMQTEVSMEAAESLPEPLRHPREEESQEKAREEGGLARERTKNLASSSGERALLLQWGQKKRSRGIRAENHHPMPCHLVDESAVLFRKTVRVHADKVSAAHQPSADALAGKATFKASNGVNAQREQPRAVAQAHTDVEEKRKKAKVLKGGASDVRQGERKGVPLGGGKRVYHPSQYKQDRVLKTWALPDPKAASASRDRCVTPQPGGNEVVEELIWPKVVIALSRREKEEDFLVLKGTKLPQRPKRRPKAVDRALLYCSPGTWLVDMSHSRYEVREKKRTRKKPRGLKAMESLDSDSDW